MNKKRIGIIILMLILLTTSTIAFGESKGNVYVIPIEGEINKATYSFVKESMEGIDPNTTDAIIFDIDTYGGLIDQAINIKDLIVSSPVPTISYINNKAVSAGVLISIAADDVVMTSSATIGSAETIPNEEKVLSMWRGVLRDTAQLKGKDARIIEAMADKDIEIEGIIEKGKLLNITSLEAEEYGISDLTANTYEEILEHFEIEEAKIVEIKENLKVKLTKYIASPYIASVLLTLGFVGMVIEILTPGFGFGGTISIIGFGLYFGGNILAGNSEWTSLILFITGLILLVVEVIVPGFGLPGIGGILFVFLGVVLAVDSVSTALFSLSVAIIVTALVTVFLVRMGFKTKLISKVVLKSNHTTERGYLSTDSMHMYIDRIGISQTELRPAGFIIIDGMKLDALAESGYISKDTEVRVVRVEGSKIFVRRV